MSSIEIRTLRVGAMQTNCYLLTSPETRKTYIVDPGDDAEYIANVIANHQLKPILILATHGHFDHVMAVAELQLTLNLPFLIHPADNFLLKRAPETAEYFLGHLTTPSWIEPIPNDALIDGQELALGDSVIKVIETPGHSPGSVCFYIKDDDIALVGDLIFADGDVGRTDYSYGNSEQLEEAVMTILSLPHETTLLPGHGRSTTVEEERVNNTQLL